MNELRLAKGRNCLIFAIAANSEEFVEQVESYDLHVNKIHLNGNINLLEVLSNWEETSEDTVYFVEGLRSQFPWILGYLNLHRDLFYEIKRPVVIFGSEYEITEITRYAPDLWRFRSRIYDITEKKEMLGDFLPILSEQSVAAEEHVHYDLPIFGKESEDEIRGRIKADNYLLEIIKEDYKRAELYMSLAISYLKLQDFESGKVYFEKTLEVRRKLNDDMGMSIDYKRFGDFYAFKREYNEAIEYYKEAIRIDPDDAAARNNLGNLLKDQGRYDEAEKEYREAIRIDPNYGEAHVNLG
ncbi:MAG: tetratricopeptide repeat protein, partial [Euryarchaeota archaeon]|nr:tetratricopeptide repeat protein [Euryarchaeota archaeon]